MLVFLAIGTIVEYLLRLRSDYSTVNFFSYFTNQSNLMVAFFFLVEGFMRIRGKPMPRAIFDRTRGALILYMTMTTSIYWLFLHKLIIFSETSSTIANVFQHSGCLAFLLIDLIWDRPQTRLGKRNFIVWLVYPVLYGLTIMLQGVLRQWYPYPFLNIDELGFGRWSIWNFSILLNISLVGLAIIFINNRLLAKPAETKV